MRDWLGPTLAAFADWTTHFAVVAAVVRFDVRPLTSPLVGAIDARALVEHLLPAIRRGGLPEPDTSALGEAFGPVFERWRDELAEVIGPSGRKPAR